MALIDDTRAAWNARANTAGGGTRVAPSRRVGISWHYNGGSPLGLAAKPHSACLTYALAMQRMHQTKGWQDIGYNLLCCPHGRVIEGRGLDLVGAHSPGVNVVHYGVQTMTGGAEPLTASQVARMRRLAADLEAHSGHSLRQWGHRDDPAASTECPGDYIERLVKAGTFAPSATSPTTAPAPAPPVPEEDDMKYPDDQYAFNMLMVDALRKAPTVRQVLTEIVANAAASVLDTAALADAVVAKLPADKDLTADDVKAALADALAESVKVTGSLTVEPKP